MKRQVSLCLIFRGYKMTGLDKNNMPTQMEDVQDICIYRLKGSLKSENKQWYVWNAHNNKHSVIPLMWCNVEIRYK